MKLARFNTLGQYHDAWSVVILCAPDSFLSFDDESVDQRRELERSFADLRDGFHFAEKRLKDARMARICREMIEMSYEAYVAGNSTLGAHSLQECEGMIWPGRALPVKHAVEAERRAYGELKVFADVTVSPYPYEGTEGDLGVVQRDLYEHAAMACASRLNEEAGFMVVWVKCADGAIREIKARSQKKAREEIKLGVAARDVIGAASAQLLVGGGLLVYHLEEAGRPLIAVMNLRRDGAFQPPRFHLNDPVTFSAPAGVHSGASITA